jgi:hypothetical protein
MLNSAYADARGVDGYLQYLVPPMNRLNQTEPATFAVFGVFKDSGFLLFIL